MPDTVRPITVETKGATLADARASSFVEMLDAFGPRLRALANNILCRPDDADEVCQEAFLTFWQNPPRQTERAAVYSWLRRVVTNLCINRLRRRKFTATTDDEAIDDRPDPRNDDPADRAETTELVTVCRDLMAELSPEKRTIISLRVLEEMSYEDMAATLNISVGTVMSRLFRARQELMGRLQRMGLSAENGQIAVTRPTRRSDGE